MWFNSILGRRKPVDIPGDLIRPDNLFHGPAGDFYAGVAAHSADIERVCYFYKQDAVAFFFYQYPRNIDGILCLFLAGVAKTCNGAVVRWPYTRKDGVKAKQNLVWVLEHKSFPVDHDRNPKHRPKVSLGCRFD